MSEKFKSIYFQLLSGGIITILVIIPLFPKLPLFSVSGTFVAVRLEDFIIALFGLLALPILWQRRKELLGNNLVLAILGFWLIGAFSTFSAIFVTQTVSPHLAALHYLRRIEYLAPFFIVLAAKPDLTKVTNYFKVLIFTSIIVVLYGMGQIWLGFPVFSTANTEFAKGIPLTLGPEARVNSTFAGHYDLAAYTALMLSILGGLLFFTPSGGKISGSAAALNAASKLIFGLSFGVRQKLVKVLILLTSIANFWLLLQTASRISFISYLVGITVVLLLLKKRAFLILVLLISFLALLTSSELRNRFFNTFKYGIKTLSYQVVPVAAQALPVRATQTATIAATPKPYDDVVPGEPTDTQQLGVFRSSRVRFDFEWPAAARAFLRNPLMGSGYSNLGLATDNDYLRSLGEVGIFGTAAFALIFLEIGKRIWGFLKKVDELNFQKTVVIGFSGMIAALLVNATFIDVFEASKIAILFWTLIGILITIIKLAYENSKSN